MKNLVLLCLLANQAQAAIQNVAVLGTTATQALIHYTAPSNSACSVEVSESPTYLPLVNDVDPAKFASASSDARPGAISNGVERLFVIGNRSAIVGLDGLRYSRALQAATQHYFRITCPATGDQAAGNFETTTIPFGATYSEPAATDPNYPGSLAYPTLSATDRTQTVIDPQTGLLLRRLTLPGDVTEHGGGVVMNVSRGPSWSNLGNLSAADGQAANISGSTAPLFLGLGPNSPYFNYQHWGRQAYQGPTGAFGYYQVHLIAAVNPGGSAPANPDDAKIVACLTKDGATCYPGSSQYEATLTTSFRDTPFGTTNTIDLWQSSPATTLPNWSEQADRSGWIYCDGSSTVLQGSNALSSSYVYGTGGAFFATNWGPGSAININGTDYTISQLVNTGQATFTGPCPAVPMFAGAFDQNSRTFRTTTDAFQNSTAGQVVSVTGAGGGTNQWFSGIAQVIDARTIITTDSPSVTGVPTTLGQPYYYFATNFGVLVRKKTASGDTIAVDYASVNYDLDIYFSFTDEGGLDHCSTNTVTGPNGRPGYNCLISAGGNMYWIDQSSGETHFMGLPNTSPYTGCPGGESQVHDTVNPDRLFCENANSVYAVTYYGNHSEPTALNATGNFGLDQSFPNCNTNREPAPYRTQQPCVVVQPLTPGTDVITLAGAFSRDPLYAPALDTVNFRNLVFRTVDDLGNLIFTLTRGYNDTLGWNFVFSPTATTNVEGGTSSGALNNHGCIGGGSPGCIIAAMPAWARPGCRWCVIKDALSPYPGWMSNQTYGWTNSQPGAGPYYVPVVDGTPNGTPNFLDGGSTLIQCPANSFGATGLNCSKLTIGSEPLSPPHGAGETGLPGEMGNAMVGDRFSIDYPLPINSLEQMMLIDKSPGTVPGTWVYTLWRRINIANGANYSNTGQKPNLYTVCAANQVLSDQPSSNLWLWNYIADPHGMNSTGQTIPPYPTSVLGHGFFSRGNAGFNFANNNETRCAPDSSHCYASVLLGTRTFAEAVQSPTATYVQLRDPGFGRALTFDSNGRARNLFFDGAGLQSHPTGGGVGAPPDRFNYLFDGRPYYGGFSSGSVNSSGDSPAVLVAGQLYKFPISSMPNIQMPFRKIFPTTANTGDTPMIDVSSPAQGDVIGTGRSDSYKYCIASVANECRQGSAVGDTFVNAPYVRYPYCFGAAQNLNLSDEYDICVGGTAPTRDAITQVNMSINDNEGLATRILTKYRRPRVLGIFDTAYVVPNGRWMVFEAQFVGDASLNKTYFLAKIPPPGIADSYNRNDFIPISITLPPLDGATKAFVRFGYAENGASTDLFCTSRHESCVVGTPSGNASNPFDPLNPFYFEQTESSTWTPIACDSGCSITLPGIPQRILYYQFVYKNDTGVVYTSPVSTTVVP